MQLFSEGPNIDVRVAGRLGADTNTINVRRQVGPIEGNGVVMPRGIKFVILTEQLVHFVRDRLADQGDRRSQPPTSGCDPKSRLEGVVHEKRECTDISNRKNCPAIQI